MGSESGQPVSVNPATIKAKVVFPQGGISITTHLWFQWANAAIRQERRAWEARRAAEDGSEREAINREVEEAMLAITAVAHAMNALAKRWRPLVPPGTKRPDLLQHVTADEGAIDKWGQPIADIYEWRGNAAHFEEGPKPVEPHPSLPTNVSAESATYTPEKATVAVDALMGVLGSVVTVPAPALFAWAEDAGSLVRRLSEFRMQGSEVEGG